MLICPFLMLPPSFSYATYAPWRRWDRGSPSIGMSQSCCRHVSFFMLVCPFLMLPPLFLCSTAQVGQGEGHPFTRPDLFWCYPLCGAGFVLCCVCPFLMLHGALSIHLHVSPSISMSPILLSTCLFSYAHGFFSSACGFPFFATGVFFMLICPFLMLPPLFLMLHGAGGTGGGAPFNKTRPFLVLSFMRSCFFFMLRLSFSFASWGAFHPSPCLSLHFHVSHPVVDMFVFLCPRVFLFCVRFPLFCHRCLFLLICPFLMLPPLLLMFHAAGGTAMSDSPSISMSPSCCRHVCFRTANLTFLCCSCPSCAPWAKGWGGGGHGAH